MSVDFSSLGSLAIPLPSTNLMTSLNGNTNDARIKQVSKAMEQVFATQLMSELGKGIDGTDDAEGGQYSDFIQQAMGQGLSSGGGLGLAKMIEQSLTRPQHVKSNLEVSKEASHVHRAH